MKTKSFKVLGNYKNEFTGKKPTKMITICRNYTRLMTEFDIRKWESHIGEKAG